MRARDASGLRAIILLASATAIVVTFTYPCWVQDLALAQYGEMINSIPGAALRGAKRDRDALASQLAGRTLTHRFGIFALFQRDTIRRSTTSDFNGFDSKTPGFLVGLDYRLLPSLAAGVLVGSKFTDLDFDKGTALSGRKHPLQSGQQMTRTFNFGVSGSYAPQSPWYGAGSLLVGLLDVHTKRRVPAGGTPIRGSTEGYMLSFLGTGGYRFFWNRIQTGPVVTCGYDYLRIGGYRETGDKQETKDLLTVNQTPYGQLMLKLGGQTTYSLPVPWGVVSPRLRLGFVYRDTFGTLTFMHIVPPKKTQMHPNTLPGNTSMELGGGATMLLPYDWQVWVDYNSYLFETATQRGILTVGIRKDF